MTVLRDETNGARDGKIAPFLLALVQAIVDDPADVRIIETVTESGILLEVSAPEKLGQVIGKGGRNIEAIGHLVTAYAAKQRLRVRISLLDAGPAVRPSSTTARGRNEPPHGRRRSKRGPRETGLPRGDGRARP